MNAQAGARASQLPSRARPGQAIRSLALGATLLLGACAMPTVEVGEPTPTEALGRLVSGETSVDEIRAVLGAPRGTGKARYRPDQPLRDVWFYERMRVKGEQVALNLLLVFIKDGRYDGYLWFSANELLEENPA